MILAVLAHDCLNNPLFPPLSLSSSLLPAVSRDVPLAAMGGGYPPENYNVDAPDGLEEPEEPFNPDYASLPALRPAQPPQYKPTPNYPSDSESIITYVQYSCVYVCIPVSITGQ